MKMWTSHLLDNLSNCPMNLKNSGDSTVFEPMTSAMPVQCSNQLSYEVAQLRASHIVGLMFSRKRNVVWKKCYVKRGVWNQMKIWSSHLLDNLSNCPMSLKNSGDSTVFKPMTSAMPVQCSNQLSYEVTQLRAGQFVGLMFSRERNVIWKKCYMKCGVWNQMKTWSSHLLDNLRNSGDSTGFASMTSAMPSFLRHLKLPIYDLPYLFGYKPISAISRDPKLLMQKINLINTNCKRVILGYKPRAIFGLEVYCRPWSFRENTKWQWL